MRFLPPKTHTTHTRKPRLWRGFLVFSFLWGALWPGRPSRPGSPLLFCQKRLMPLPTLPPEGKSPFSPFSTILGRNVENFFLLPQKKRRQEEMSTRMETRAARRRQPEKTGGTGKGFSAMPCRGLSGKRTPRGHCPAAEKREAMPLGRKTTGNRGFSPLTGGEKGDKVFPDSKRQRTGRVAAGRSQEKGRVVQVPALRRQ